MKTRNDFVSNSSSSSFILAKNPLFDYFKITKKDIIDALTSLSCAGFEVYDLKVESDKEKAIKDHGDILSEFDCNYATLDSEGNLDSVSESRLNSKRYDNLAWEMKSILDIHNFNAIFNPYDENDKPYIYDYKERKELPVPEHVIETLKMVRKECGIITNLEALKLPDSEIFIHFGENDIWSISGMTKYGKPDIKFVKDKELIENPDKYKNVTTDTKDVLSKSIDEEIINDINSYNFETEHSSLDRFLEILIRYFTSVKKIKPDDEDFLLSYDKALDYDGKKSDGTHHTNNGTSYTYEDLYEDVLAFCGHEG